MPPDLLAEVLRQWSVESMAVLGICSPPNTKVFPPTVDRPWEDLARGIDFLSLILTYFQMNLNAALFLDLEAEALLTLTLEIFLVFEVLG